jgi:hypothetical protein
LLFYYNDRWQLLTESKDVSGTETVHAIRE